MRNRQTDSFAFFFFVVVDVFLAFAFRFVSIHNEIVHVSERLNLITHSNERNLTANFLSVAPFARHWCNLIIIIVTITVFPLIPFRFRFSKLFSITEINKNKIFWNWSGFIATNTNLVFFCSFGWATTEHKWR